jgi:O-antigen/teichoic acid export membrane protein
MRIAHVIAGNLATGFIGRLVSALTPILLTPFMIKTWGLDVYGEWLILTAIPTYIMLAPDFGLAGAVVNRMAFLTAAGKETEAVYLYRSAFIVLLIASGVFVGFGWLIAQWLDWSWTGITKLEFSAATIIGWSCVQIFITQQGFLLSGIYRCARRNPRLGLLHSIGQAFYLAVSLLSLYLDCDPALYVLILVSAYALFHAVIFIDTRKIMPSFTISRNGVSLGNLKPYVIPGFGHAGMPIIHALQNQGVLILLGSIVGPAGTAIFQTMRVLSNGVKSILGLLAGAVMVELPALLGEEKNQLVEKLLVRNTQVGILVVIVAIAAMLLLGEKIYHAWLGGQAHYDSLLVLLLLSSLLPFAVGQSFGILLSTSNKIHRAILPFILIAICSLGAVYVGGYLAGLPGAALGVLVFEMGISAASLSIAKSEIESPWAYFKDCINYRPLFYDVGTLFTAHAKSK